MASEDPLPVDLLEAVAYPGGGRVVLVLGAGCSVDPPTNLPLAGALSRECYRRLVEDGVMAEDACDSPDDLSAVADAVFAATDSQRALVERFPPDRFRRAAPNEGHRIAAALMREGAVSNIVSLNFDLAEDAALTNVSAGAEVATISGPEEHHRLIAQNLIYLHRPITADADQLILRTVALDEAWRGGWEEVITGRVVGGSVTVFVGLGSPAGVLVESTRRIVAAVGEGARVYVVDPSERDRSRFFEALGLDPDVYVRLGWSNLMQRLGDRVVEEHRAELENTCQEMIRENEWADENVHEACTDLAELGLLPVGRVRARWLLRGDEYAPRPRDGEVRRLLADLMLGIVMLARLTESRPRFDVEGFIELEGQGRSGVAVLVCSGGGSRRWAAVETHARFRAQQLRGRRVGAALVAGVAGPRTDIAPPPDIAGESDANNLIVTAEALRIVTVEELREDAAAAQRILG
jgi:hypothetical protein